jgi:2-iminobutanoate/2-iminopropanoate deaminase
MRRTRFLFVTVAGMLLASASLAQMSPKYLKKFHDPSDGQMPFSTAVRAGDLLFLSGALAYRDGKLVEGGITAETRVTLEIIAERLREQNLGMADVVKCTVFLADIDDFAAMNEVYMEAFSPPRPARTTVAVSGLALDAAIEIECIAAYDPGR